MQRACLFLIFSFRLGESLLTEDRLWRRGLPRRRAQIQWEERGGAWEQQWSGGVWRGRSLDYREKCPWDWCAKWALLARNRVLWRKILNQSQGGHLLAEKISKDRNLICVSPPQSSEKKEVWGSLLLMGFLLAFKSMDSKTTSQLVCFPPEVTSIYSWYYNEDWLLRKAEIFLLPHSIWPYTHTYTHTHTSHTK